MKLDPVDQKALKGPHSSAKDKDINNDGKVNSSDEYLHNRRQAVSKAIGKLKEEAEELDELSKKTLGSYRTKAARDDKDRSKGRNISSAKMYPDQYKNSPLKAKVSATEETELDEISKDMADRYYRKAAGDIGSRTTSAIAAKNDAYNSQFSSRPQSKNKDEIKARIKNTDRKIKNRAIGMSRASSRMEEEAEQIDEVSASTLGSYIRKSSKDADASMKKRDDALDNDDGETARKMGRIARKRDKGTSMAMDKLKGTRYAKVHATEEADLDEAKNPNQYIGVHDNDSLVKHFGYDTAIDARRHSPAMMFRKGKDGKEYALTKVNNRGHYEATPSSVKKEEADDASTIAKHTQPLRMKLSQFRHEE